MPKKIITFIFAFVLINALCVGTYVKIITDKYENLKVSEVAKSISVKTQNMNHKFYLYEQNVINFRTEAKEYYKLKNKDFGEDITIANLEDFPSADGGGIWFEPYKFNHKQKENCIYASWQNDKAKIDDYYFKPEYNYLNQSWYTQIKSEIKSPTQVVWTKPYKDKNGTGNIMITAGTGIFDKGTLVGLVTIDAYFDELVKMCNEIQPSMDSKILLGSIQNDYVIRDAGDKQNAIIQSYDKDLSNYIKNEPQKGKIAVNDIDYDGIKYVSFATILDNGFFLAVNIPRNEIFEKTDLYNTIAIALLLIVSLSSAGALAYFILKCINE